MSIQYYNLPEFPKFLPIIETIGNGRVHSFVSKIDNDMDLDTSNWNHFVTTNAIKSYIDARVESLKTQNYLFEDYFIINDTILDTSSGAVITDNITNIFYPNTTTSVKFNTTNSDIKFDSENLKLTIPKNTDKVVSSFKYKTNIPQVNLLSNEDFTYPITWNKLLNYSDITITGLHLQANESVTYKLPCDSSIPVNVSLTNTGSVSSSYSNNVLTLTNSNTDNDVSKVVVTESNIINQTQAIESLNSYYDATHFEYNSYWNMYTLGKKRQDFNNLIHQGPTHCEKTTVNNETLYLYRMNPLTRVQSDDLISFGTNNILVTFQIKVSSENTNFYVEAEDPTRKKPQHLVSFGGVDFYITNDGGIGENFYLEYELNNIIRTPISYDQYHTIRYDYRNGELLIYVDGVIVYNQTISLRLEDSRIVFGNYKEYPGFYGEVVAGKDVNNVPRALISGGNWSWNTNTLDKETKFETLETNKDLITNTNIITPVFDPDNARWSFDIDLLVDKNTAPSSYDIVSMGTSSFQGINLRYNKSQNAIEIKVNSKEACYSTSNRKGFPNPITNSRVSCKSVLTTSGKCHIKVEFTGYSYNVYSDELGTRKIGELKTSTPIEPSYIRINACDGININKNYSYILLEDSIWWSFETLNYTEDYQYCNLEISNNVSVVNNQTVPVSNQIIRFPFSRSNGALAEITFIPTSYVADNNVIISSLLYSSDGILIYQKSASTIYVKANKNANEVLLGNYELNKKYHIRIEDKATIYQISLFDKDYTPINSIDVANNKSEYMTGLLLGSSTDTSVASGIKFLLNECKSDNFAWNFIQPKSFLLKEGTRVYSSDPKSVSTTSYSFTERIVGFDTQITDIKNNIFYRYSNTSLLQPTVAVPLKIQIVNNKTRVANIAYVDIALNDYIINNVSNYGVVIGGLYHTYEEEGINHYIYPRHISNRRRDYGGIKFNYIETGNKYNFTYNDIVYNGTYNYQIGDITSKKLSKSDATDSIIIMPVISNSDCIKIIGKDNLVSTTKIQNMEMLRLSHISNGNFTDNNWMYKKTNNKEKYSYFSNIENKDYAIVIGSLVNSSDTIYPTSNFFEKYDITSSTFTNKIVATRNDIPALIYTTLNNSNSSKIYSIDLFQNYIKSGDFSVLTDWDFTCRNYSIIQEGFLTINGSKFDLAQNILEMQDEEVSRYLVNVGEEVLLTFTISNYESGKVILDYGADTITYNSNGTYSIIFNILSKEQRIRLYSDVDNNKLVLSNISLISLNKIANSTFQSPTYWQFTDASIFTDSGITLSQNQFIGQNIYLREGKKYTGTIRIDDITNNLFVFVNDEKVATFNTAGVYDFDIVSNTNDTNIRIEKDLGSGTASVSFIKVREKSYISDSNLQGMVNSWDYDCDNVYIEDNKLIIDGGETKQITSGKIVPNTQYKLSFDLNILQGSVDLYVGDNTNNKLLKSYNVSNNGHNEISFLSTNSSDCRLLFVASIDTKLSIEYVELELVNYIIDFSDIAYNWQTTNNKISIIDRSMVFNNVESNGKVSQYNYQLVPNSEITVQIKANITSGELKLYYGNTEVGTITNGLHDYTGTMDSTRNINIIASQNNTTAKIEVFSLMKKMDNFTLDAEASVLDSARNLSLTEINLSSSLSGFEYYDGKLIGLKIGNVFATGYLNVKDSRIENVNRSKEYFKINLDDTDVQINKNNTIELLEPNYIFIDNEGNITVTSKVEYGKYRKEVSLNAEVWYNLIDKAYYTSSNKMVYLIGKAFVNKTDVVFTENIQKQRKLLSYTKPYIKGNTLIKSEKGLYDISTLFFNGTSRTLFDTTKPYGKYIVYRKITSSSNPYNLDVNSLYVDYDSNHMNKSASWNSDRNMFVSPYTLDEAICEIHHSASGQKYYDLTREYDIIEVEGTYDRLTYKNPDHSVTIILSDGTEQNVTISSLSSNSQAVGTKVYWRN